MHSALTPDAFQEALRRAIDPEHWAVFSLSGYEGTRPILGEVDRSRFRLQMRRISRNDFSGHFYGKVEPESGGARVEGYFAAPRWARYFVRFWVAFAVIGGVPLFVTTLRDVHAASGKIGDLWVGLIVPPALIFQQSDTPRGAGGLMSWAASKAVGPVIGVARCAPSLRFKTVPGCHPRVPARGCICEPAPVRNRRWTQHSRVPRSARQRSSSLCHTSVRWLWRFCP